MKKDKYFNYVYFSNSLQKFIKVRAPGHIRSGVCIRVNPPRQGPTPINVFCPPEPRYRPISVQGLPYEHYPRPESPFLCRGTNSIYSEAAPNITRFILASGPD